MKRMKRWLGIMLSILLAAESLQVPVHAAETGETVIEEAAGTGDTSIEEAAGTGDTSIKEAAETEDTLIKAASEGQNTETDDHNEAGNADVGSTAASSSDEEAESASEEDIDTKEAEDDRDPSVPEDDSEDAPEDAPEDDPEASSSEELREETSNDAAQAVASGTCGNSLNWTLDFSGTLEITGSGAMSDYSHSYYQASYNSPWYPYCESITEVSLPDGITHIGNCAFFACSNLDELEIPDSVTSLGYFFLEDSAVSSIRIPASISSCNTMNRYLGHKAGPLAGSNVTEVIFAEGTKVIPDYICKGEPYIDQIGEIEYYKTIVDTVVIPEGVETIGEGAFGDCEKLGEIRIPYSVTEIKGAAFQDYGSRCTLHDVYYGGSEDDWKKVKIDGGNDLLLNADIHYEGKNALELADRFTGAEGEEILITAEIKSSGSIPDEGNIEWEVSPLEGQTGKITWKSASVKSNGGDSYNAERPLIIDEEGKYRLTVSFGDLSETAEILVYSWKLENGTLTVYSNRAMKEYSDSTPAPWSDQRADIEHIVIKDKVDLISSYAFSGCSNAKDVSIGKKVKSIGDYAFRSCYSLLDPAIPEGVEAIGGGAYQNCYSMRTVLIPSSVREMGENPFTVFLRDGEERYPSAISLSEIRVAQGNQYFAAEDGVLYDRGIKKLISYPAGREGELFAIPNTVETIGQKAFANCAVLKKVSIPEQVSYIGDFAFASYSRSGRSYMSVEAVCFMKDAPGFAPNSFYKYSKHAYYLLNNATWTDSVKQNYGGSVIWEDDQDQDGISDGWELCGADIDNDSVVDLDFPRMGASIEYPDIFVEVDWMVGYEPMSEALDRVCEKFNDHGIHLHIDAGPNSVDFVTGNPWGQMSFGGSTMPYSQYFDLADSTHQFGNWIKKADAHMGPNRASTFHHFFFVNHWRDDTGGGINASGVTISDSQLSIVADCDGWISGTDKTNHSNTYGKTTAQAGTFMHELGHSLGLAHASTTSAYPDSQYDDNMSHQPNHLSVMNYAFQTRGFIGSKLTHSDYDINYSEYELPEIDEDNVDETRGIDPNRVITNKDVHTRWHYADANGGDHVTWTGSLAGKHIDFDHNFSASDTNLRIDLNADGQYTVMTPSVNEWDILDLYSGYIGNGADLGDAWEQIREDSIEIPQEYTTEMDKKWQDFTEEEYIDPEPTIIAEGELESSLFWKLNENGVLTVYGDGNMPEFLSTDLIEEYEKMGLDPYDLVMPWVEYRDDICEIVIEEGVLNASSHAFMDCRNCHTVTIAGSVTSIGDEAFSGCEGLKTLNWQEGIESIGEKAFLDCDSLLTVEIPEGVRYLGSYAFAWSDSLESAVIPDSVEEGGINIFGEDTALSDVTMGSGMAYVPQGIFYACTALEQITVPEGVKELSFCVFEECSSLQSIYLPESLESVYEDAFRECGALKSVYYSGTRAQWKEIEIGPGNNCLRTQIIRCADGDLRLITTSMVTLSQSAYTYSGQAFTPAVTVRNGGTVLKEGTHYTVRYLNNINAGTATVAVTGKGEDYWGTAKKTFTILPGKTTRGDMFNLANNVKVTWKEVSGAKYYKVYRQGVTDPDESLDEPVIVTTGLVGWDKSPGLTNGHAYRYKIVASLTGKGDPSGDSPLSYSKFMYRLKTVVIRSVKNTAPGKVTVKYDKTTSGDSYVLQYCERQDMVGAKTKVVLGASNTSYVIGGLKKGRTYYISIRVRKKVNGIDYYTTFGVAKKVMVTK